MLIEYVHNNLRYTLSNDKLKVDDKVYPIGWGRCTDDGGWILHNLDYRELMSGFPYDPHTIVDMHYSDSKTYEVHTNHGFSPRESYYKIVKVEKHVKVPSKHSTPNFDFSTWVWKEITMEELHLQWLVDTVEKPFDIDGD